MDASLHHARAVCEEIRRETEHLRAALQPLLSEARQARESLEECRQQFDTIQQQMRQATQEFRQAEEFVARAQADAQSAQTCFEQVVRDSALIERTWREAREQHTEAQEATREAETALLRAREQSDEARRELQAARSEANEALEQAHRLRERLQPWRESPPIHEPVPAVAAPAPNDLPTESIQERLVRYLNDAWALEHNAVDMFHNMAEEVTDPVIREALEDYRSLSHEQQQRLATRLDALGQEPSGSKGVLHQMMSRIWDALHRPRDGADRTLQDLIQGLGTVHFTIAMYQALESYARAANDEVSAELANELLREEIDAAERLRPLLTPAAVRAAVPA
jgi:ferritin-like metal-binding protein YciE